jgi:hypothetical protein
MELRIKNVNKRTGTKVLGVFLIGMGIVFLFITSKLAPGDLNPNRTFFSIACAVSFILGALLTISAHRVTGIRSKNIHQSTNLEEDSDRGLIIFALTLIAGVLYSLFGIMVLQGSKDSSGFSLSGLITGLSILLFVIIPLPLGLVTIARNKFWLKKVLIVLLVPLLMLILILIKHP